jgi:hypothetical protein
MSGIFILPILQSHDEDQLRVDASAKHHILDREAFDQELVDRPQPFFPLGDEGAASPDPEGSERGDEA